MEATEVRQVKSKVNLLPDSGNFYQSQGICIFLYLISSDIFYFYLISSDKKIAETLVSLECVNLLLNTVNPLLSPPGGLFNLAKRITCSKNTVV